MTVVVVGAGGQLGRALLRARPGLVGLTRADLDVADLAAVLRRDWDGVTAIVNAAAWTAVDAAEQPENLAAVRAANVDAVGHLAEVARRTGATLVHVSSEYVFDGRHPGPMPEDLTPSPLSVYGRSKADGDREAQGVEHHYVIRTSWVVGDGPNFVRVMAGLAARGVSPSVVADQVGRPTSANDLAAGILHLLDVRAPFGTYNLTGDGEPASWADVASAVFVASGRAAEDVHEVTTGEYFADKPSAAPRPLNSVLALDKVKGTGFTPRAWTTVLDEQLGPAQS
ncbi:SDR family oxidoreductase [Geodermatophilus sp. SYSU D00698]